MASLLLEDRIGIYNHCFPLTILNNVCIYFFNKGIIGMPNNVGNTNNTIATAQTLSFSSESIQPEGQLEGRSVSQLPSSNIASYAKQVVDSIAKGICSALKWIGVVAGGLSVVALSVATLAILPAIWNAAADNENDIFSTFMNTGGQIGLSIGQFITGRQDRDL